MKKGKKEDMDRVMNTKSSTMREGSLKKAKNKILEEMKLIKMPKLNFKEKVNALRYKVKGAEEKKTPVKENKEAKGKLIKIKFPDIGFKWKMAGARKLEDKTSEDKKIILPKLKSAYETDFDRIYEVVEKENIVTLSRISEAFNVDKAIAQKWGEMLSEHELIEYRVPAFGEPEFRKKGLLVEQKNKISKNKKIAIGLSFAGVFLLSLVGFFVVTGLLQDTGDRINAIRPMPLSEKNANAVSSESVKNAFSGNGTYICRGGNVNYYIRDQLLRAEGVDKKSTIIVKSGSMYVHNPDNGNWIKTEVRKDIVLPGSGKLPENVNCKKEDVSASLFDIPEGKII